MTTGKVYVIERDERDKGGKLVVLGTYNSYDAAAAAWDLLAVPEDEDVQLWLLIRNGKSDVIDFKCK